jgi:hypothetical protein
MPRSRIAHHLVALTAVAVVTSAWVAGVASAASSDTDGDGLLNTYERDGRDLEVVDTAGLVNTP